MSVSIYLTWYRRMWRRKWTLKRMTLNIPTSLSQRNHLTISTELQVPATMRLSKKTSILELEHSNETWPEFFAFTIKFRNFIHDTYHIWELEGSEVNWVCLWLCSYYEWRISATLQFQVYKWHRHESLDNGATRDEFVHMHKKFHGWKHEEAVIFSKSGTIRFTKIIKLFNVLVQGSISTIALAQEYCLASPLEYIGNDQIIGFPLLQLEPPQCTFFVPVVKFIRWAFIVPMTDQHHLNYYLLNDVINTDMFFCLRTLVQDRLVW